MSKARLPISYADHKMIDECREMYEKWDLIELAGEYNMIAAFEFRAKLGNEQLDVMHYLLAAELKKAFERKLR